MLAPESHEIKPRHGTAGRSAIVKNSAHGTDRRPMVIDGRVRAAPSSKSSFALFWLVQRCSDKKDPAINLELTYTHAHLKLNLKFDIDGKKSSFAMENDAADMPSIPILVNPAKIKKHSRLVVKEDLELKKLADELEKERFKEKDAKNKKGEPAKALGEPAKHTNGEPANKRTRT